MSEEKTEKVTLQELEKAVTALLTPEVMSLIEHPIEILDSESERWFPVGMRMFPPEAIVEYNRRFGIILPVWEKLAEVLDRKKSAKNQTTDVKAEIQSRILADATPEDLATVAATVQKVNYLLDAVANNDARSILVAQSLSRISSLFDGFATEAVSNFGIPEDLREQKTETLLVNFNDAHNALKDLQKNVNGLYEALWQNWDQYKEFFAEDQYRLNDKKLPMHPKDGRAIRSKFAHEPGDEETAFVRVYGHRALNYSIGFKIGSGAEVVRDMTADYRDPQFALPNFLREVNRTMSAKKVGTSFGFIDSALLIHWIRATDPELEKKSDTDVLQKADWTVKVPGTEVVIRRIPEAETPEAEAEAEKE